MTKPPPMPGNKQDVADEIRLLRPEEVAKMLGCSKWFVYYLAKYGELPSVNIGRIVRFDPKDVVEFVNQHRKERR